MTAKQIALEALSVLERASRDMLATMIEDHERTRYFYLGYTRDEERQWLLFNRCCHPGHDIRIKDRPFLIRVGNPSFSVRQSPFVHPR